MHLQYKQQSGAAQPFGVKRAQLCRITARIFRVSQCIRSSTYICARLDVVSESVYSRRDEWAQMAVGNGLWVNSGENLARICVKTREYRGMHDPESPIVLVSQAVERESAMTRRGGGSSQARRFHMQPGSRVQPSRVKGYSCGQLRLPTGRQGPYIRFSSQSVK